MAECPIKNCDWRGKKSGVPIHLGRVHKLRFQHEVLESESNVLASESNAPHGISMVECPVPGCHQNVPDLLSHFQEAHPEWWLSNGRFVFEV